MRIRKEITLKVVTMNKLCLLPLSLILLNHGFSEDITFESDDITAFSELNEEMYFEEQPYSDSSTAQVEDDNNGFSSLIEPDTHYNQENQEPPQRSAPPVQLEAPKPALPSERRKAQRPPVKPERSYSVDAPAHSSPKSHGRPSVKKSPRAQIRASRKQISQGEQQRTAKKKAVVQNNDNDDQMNSYNQGQMQQSGAMTRPRKKKTTNTPARPFIKNGYDFWLFGEALFWQASEENLPYATQVKATDNRRKLNTIDFNWDWGFRVGLGGNSSRDGWDIDIYWTRIRNETHNRTHGTSSTAIQEFWTTAANAEPLGTFNEAKAHGHSLLNQIDLDLGREFYVGNFLTTRPFVGLRYTWIHQKYHVEYGNSIDEFAKLRSRFWGFGFAAGLDTNWWLGNGFSIYGDSDISVIFGNFNVHEKGTLSGSTIWTASNKTNAGRPIFDIGMGFQYRDTFCDESFALTIRAGYEYHLYFNQNMFIQVNNGSSTFENFNPLGGNLGYQGASASMQFDF